MRRDSRLRPALIIFAIFVALWLIVPMLVVVPMSFSGDNTFAFPPKSWGLHHYETFFTKSNWLRALSTSLQLAVFVTIIATVLGTLAAFGLTRYRFRGSSIIDRVLLAPLIVPGIVVAVAVYATFLSWRLVGNPIGFVAAHTVLAIPFVVVNVRAALAGLNPLLERAAASLGATPFATFRQIVFPIIRPGVTAGALFAFVTSFDEVVVSLFLQSPTFQTLPVRMYNAVAEQADPAIAVAATLVLVLSTTLIGLAQLTRRTRRSA